MILPSNPPNSSPEQACTETHGHDTLDLGKLAEPLVERCRNLLSEIDSVNGCIKRHGLPDVELRAFRSNVHSELKFLKAIASRKLGEKKTQHSLRSSNLGYFELVWNAAKASSGLLSILTHVQEGGIRPSIRQEKDRKTVQVEIIAQRGLQWIKLSTITEDRLIIELAKAGWEGPLRRKTESDTRGDGIIDEAEPETEEAEDDEQWNDRALSTIPLIQTAELLSKASRNTWVDYQHPQVVYVFHRITANTLRISPIRKIFKKLESFGLTVCFADDVELPQPIDTVLENFRTKDQYAHFSDTLNIDCTVLLALASDISNYQVPPHSHFNPAILRQLELETHTPLLPSMLFPAFRDRRLVCTKHALQRFDEIIQEIGTQSEKDRAALITEMAYPSEDISEEQRQEMLTKFQELSIHKIPRDWKLPIRTLPVEYMDGIGTPGAKHVASLLTPINQSVFGTGWMMGITTVTSNATVAKQISDTYTNWMENNGATEKGPKVWILYTARSLIGKGWK